MEENQLINAQEVAYRVGCSVPTLNSYYKYKREYPDTELALMIPDFVQKGGRAARYWRESDVEAIRVFRSSLPTGRNGLLGKVTQKYVKKSVQKEKMSVESTYIRVVTAILEKNGVHSDIIEQVTGLLKIDSKLKNQMG